MLLPNHGSADDANMTKDDCDGSSFMLKPNAEVAMPKITETEKEERLKITAQMVSKLFMSINAHLQVYLCAKSLKTITVIEDSEKAISLVRRALLTRYAFRQFGKILQDCTNLLQAATILLVKNGCTLPRTLRNKCADPSFRLQ